MKKIVQDEGGMFDEDTELTLWAEEGKETEAEKTVRDENGRCHDDRGYLTSCGGGKGSTGGKDPGKTEDKQKPRRNSDLPPWMQEKPKPEKKPEPKAPPKTEEKPRQESEEKPSSSGKNLSQLVGNRLSKAVDLYTMVHLGLSYPTPEDGSYPYPDAKSARLDLKPMVGKKVKVDYWVEHRGGPSITDPTKPSHCVKGIKIDGIKQEIAHVWLQEAPAKVRHAKYGQTQEAYATVTAYDKGKKGEPRFMDYSVQMFEDIVDKSAPVAKVTRDENGRCHDDNGYLTSCGGGSGDKPSSKPDKKPEDKPDKEPSSKPEDDFDPNDVPTPGGEKKPGKPEALPEDEDPGFPEDKQPKTAPLTGPEQLAVSTYQGADYAFINTWMRNPDNGGNKQDREYYLRKAENIARAIDKQPPLKGEEIVYRGIRTNKETIKAFVMGAVIEDPAFMSTTTDREIAKNFGNTIITIRVPKGTKALRMTDVVDNVSSRTEAEMLLQRKTKIKITHVRQESGGLFGMGAKTYIEARVI